MGNIIIGPSRVEPQVYSSAPTRFLEFPDLQLEGSCAETLTVRCDFNGK
jgi:hypothetical protein